MDPILAELIQQLLRRDQLSISDIDEMAQRLRHEGLTDEAYNLQVCVAEALAPTPDEHAQTLRSRIHVVPDGGNSTN